MPCNSDYMEPNQNEINLAKVEALLEELKTGKLPAWYGNGNHHSIYNQATKERLNVAVVSLCDKLQKVPDIKIFSLEMQMWWRDHKAADIERIKSEMKENAMAKLSDFEKGLLFGGIDNQNNKPEPPAPPKDRILIEGENPEKP